jgi:tRNA(Ile)-lysidine synthase TilS/MesJ
MSSCVTTIRAPRSVASGASFQDQARRRARRLFEANAEEVIGFAKLATAAMRTDLLEFWPETVRSRVLEPAVRGVGATTIIPIGDENRELDRPRDAILSSE